MDRRSEQQKTDGPKSPPVFLSMPMSDGVSAGRTDEATGPVNAEQRCGAVHEERGLLECSVGNRRSSLLAPRTRTKNHAASDGLFRGRERGRFYDWRRNNDDISKCTTEER